VEQIITFIFLGLGPGALIGGIALSIVLFYRGSGTINLATGSMAMLGAYVFYDLRTSGYVFLPPPLPAHLGNGRPWPALAAALVALLVCAVIGGLFDWVVLGRLRGASPLAKLLSSLGLLLIIQALIVIRFGTTGQTAPSLLPDLAPLRVFGANVPRLGLVLAGIVLLAALVLSVVYRFSPFGLATRAAAENETKAILVGLAPGETSLINSVVASVLAGALGVLAAPSTQLDPTTIALAVVPALGAALIAGFTSFPIAVTAALGMGIVQSLVTYASSKPWFPQSQGAPIPGVAEIIYFLVIVGALLWRHRSLPARGETVEPRLPEAPAARRVALPAIVGSVACVVALLVLPFDFRQALIYTLIGVLICLSLVVTTGFAGQVSFVQVGIAGAAAFTVSKIGTAWGIGFPWALILAAVVAMVLGIVIGFSAVRVRGVSLAIVTLAAAVVLESAVFANPSINGGANGSPVTSPSLFGINLGPNAAFPWNAGSSPSPVFGFLCVAVVVLVGLLVANLRKSDLGMRMLAVRSNERAASAAGVHVARTKLIAFAVASFIAGLAGGLYAYNFGGATPERFGVVVSLAFVGYAYLGGISTVSGAVWGGVLATGGLSIQAINVWFGVSVAYQPYIGGIALLLTIIFNPEGIAGAMSKSFHASIQPRLQQMVSRPGSRQTALSDAAR
jgi:branched-chain amino acid transport system permease protein